MSTGILSVYSPFSSVLNFSNPLESVRSMSLQYQSVHVILERAQKAGTTLRNELVGS